MKRKVKGQVFHWLLGLTIVVYSCTDQIERDIVPNQDSHFLIKEARDYFENEFNPEQEESPSSRQGEQKRQGIRKNLLWNKAFVRQLEDSTKGIVIPLKFDEELFLRDLCSPTSLSSLSYILIYDDKKGNKNLEVVTTLPDSTYLISSEVKKRFSGLVYVENWNGKLLKSIRHMNGRMYLYENEDDQNSNGRIAEMARCETTTDWYSCGSSNGGLTWSCAYDYTEVVVGWCENGGGSGSPQSSQCTTCFNYQPAAGSSNPSGGNSPDPDEPQLPTLVEPCVTDDNIVNNAKVQKAFDTIWKGSNALNTSVPMSARLEQGGWITLKNGIYSYVPFPSSWTRTPCG